MSRVRVISVFNNKGGVGKTTLTFHLAHALSALGKRVLLVDLDPQCNLTMHGLSVQRIEEIWKAEDSYIDGAGFETSRSAVPPSIFEALNEDARTIHYILKPTEEGTGELPGLPPPVPLATNLDLIPGRLTLHQYEEKISSRWSDVYQGDPLAIRTMTRIRRVIEEYARTRSYDIVIVDTSPSLGALNKIAISTVDGFLVPCLPDVFSLYGVRNIGNSLSLWKTQFDTVYKLLSDAKRRAFPQEFVRFLGFTIYNAKKYTGSTEWDLAQAHYSYAQQIPATVQNHIPADIRGHLKDSILQVPIGAQAVMHTHNTLPAMAQKYRMPIWEVPSNATLESSDKSTVMGNRKMYEATKAAYAEFAKDVLSRIDLAMEPSS
jgi:cellulose biosynthesis protein BcsQ